MAKAEDYSLGPSVYPRGWFIVAETKELDAGPLAVRFFGQDFALYRGESGRIAMLDAYCAHMGTHLAASTSAAIVKSGEQIEGDSIRCPYHGWRYDPDGVCDDIPYHDGPCPKSASLKSYPVKDVMGCVMMWFDPEGGAPEYEAPYLQEWDDPSWVRWELDHLGRIEMHPQEILDNMADAQHLGPTHGAPCEYFENEIKDHIIIQRQGGFHKVYDQMLTTATWYTGPGVLLSKQKFGTELVYELIANTPVEDGLVQVWHAVLAKSAHDVATEEDIAIAREVQAGALDVFGADFSVWQNKRPALKIMQLKTDGPFGKGRKWYQQFYDTRVNASNYQQEANGVYHISSLDKPGDAARQLETGLFDS
ncbi:MAG: Rieske 2Fe-2S domain-containing protein [Pseudomonadales bacterium]